MSQRMYSSQGRFFIVCKALTFCGDGLLASCPDSKHQGEECPLSNVREGTFSKFGFHVKRHRDLLNPRLWEHTDEFYKNEKDFARLNYFKLPKE